MSNQVRRFILTLLFHFDLEFFSGAIEVKEMYNNWKEGKKNLFADDMIVYSRKP